MKASTARTAPAQQASRAVPGRRKRLRTDLGTVAFHWAVVAALAASLATGLAVAADAPDRTWLRALRFMLPAGEVWSWHIYSGTFLAACAAGYVVYLRRSGLGRRVALDRPRLYGLLTGGRPRWAAVNVALYWVAFGLLGLQLATGLLLYLGFGGWLVSVHYAVALALLAYPLLHVAAHFGYGGLGQVLRIFLPTRRIDASPPPDLVELVRRHMERSARPEASDRQRTLHAHPLTVATIVAAAAGILSATLDQSARDRLLVTSISPADAPRLDGDLSDPVWRRAVPVAVETQQGANLGGTGASRVTVRALHDGRLAYLAFTWEDPTRSLKHLPLIKRADGWHLLHTHYDIEDENSYYEDKFAVLLAQSSEMPAAGTIHLGAQPLAGKPPAFSGRGLHYTTDGSVVDMWHWKAARGGLAGGVDDNYFGPPAEPKEAEVAGRSRYKAGYQADKGKAPFENNFAAEPPGGYRAPLKPKRLPRNYADLAQAMGPVNLEPEASEAPGARWWMTPEESAPYAPEIDAAIPVGTVIPGVILSGAYGGDRGDVRCAAQWAAGRWTLEVARQLDTGSPHDVAIRTGTSMWVAVFDHTQTRHTRHMRPIRIEVLP